MNQPTRVLFAVAALAALPAVALAQEPQPQPAVTPAALHEHGAPQHIAVSPDEIQWMPAPPVLPAGAQLAVLEGDPTKEGPFTMRLKLPDGYSVAPHYHPVTEHVTVISGTFGIGLGEVWDESKIEDSGPGGFYVMQPGVRHFARTKGETVIQLHSMGGWSLTYVNPTDDPRNQPTSSTY